MKQAFESLTRRGALAASAAAGALATIAHGLFTSPMLSRPMQPVPIATGQPRGYRVTEHVRRYYRSTLL